jgi:hypothetical protein
VIIWSGYGYLVAVFVFAVSLLMEIAVESATGDDGFYQREAWPFALAMATASVLCLVVGLKLNSIGARRLIDPETNEEVFLPSGDHSLLFLKLH